MILFLSGQASRDLRRIADELAAIRGVLTAQTTVLERIAIALETTPQDPEISAIEWHVSEPEQEN